MRMGLRDVVRGRNGRAGAGRGDSPDCSFSRYVNGYLENKLVEVF
jgi:hypothetical protein